MRNFIIIYNVLSTLIALFSIGYVTTDVVREQITRKREGKAVVLPNPAEETVAPPEPTPETEAPMPLLDAVDAERADELLSDSAAMKRARRACGAGAGVRCIVNIGDISRLFEAGETVTLSLLKTRGLAPKRAGRVKILSDGTLDKPLSVKAESFSLQAIKMIELTGGEAIILRD